MDPSVIFAIKHRLPLVQPDYPMKNPNLRPPPLCQNSTRKFRQRKRKLGSTHLQNACCHCVRTGRAARVQFSKHWFHLSSPHCQKLLAEKRHLCETVLIGLHFWQNNSFSRKSPPTHLPFVSVPTPIRRVASKLVCHWWWSSYRQCA